MGAQEPGASSGIGSAQLPATNAGTDSDASKVVSEVIGEVTDVLVQVGQSVRAGQALVRIDPRDAALADTAAKLQIDAARAELASAEADFKRYTDLRDKSFISQAEWERRAAAIASARANFEASVDRLGLYTARATRDATVVAVAIRKGQSVGSGQPLVRLRLNAPGQDLDAMASAGSPSKGIRVPLTAIVGGDSVMRIESAGAGFLVKKVAVRIGDADDRFVRIDAGLAMGDRVVAVGAHLLTDGQAVRLAPQGP